MPRTLHSSSYLYSIVGINWAIWNWLTPIVEEDKKTIIYQRFFYQLLKFFVKKGPTLFLISFLYSNINSVKLLTEHNGSKKQDNSKVKCLQIHVYSTTWSQSPSWPFVSDGPFAKIFWEKKVSGSTINLMRLVCVENDVCLF